MICFDEDIHQYSRGGIIYQSVSSVIEQFIDPFPADIIAGNQAKKLGVPKESILDQWEINNKISRDYGHAIHGGIELYYKYGIISKLSHVSDAVNSLIQKYPSFSSEIVMYDDDLKIAGTMDGYMPDNGIIDIKTNAELKEDDGYFKSPLNHIRYSTINKYRIQLSLYKYMVEKITGKTVPYIKLEHWDGIKFNTIDISPINIEPVIKYLTK